MNTKKTIILLPDGVGLRNFAFGKFYHQAKKENFDVTYWNNTDFPLSDLGFKDIEISKNGGPKAVSDLYKRAKKIIELKRFYKKFNQEAFKSYLPKHKNSSIKTFFKNTIVNSIVFLNNSDTGLEKVKKNILKFERKTRRYRDSKLFLEKEKPNVLFLTNHRPLSAVAPLIAAKDLGIPTISFIFSWDNLPKGTLVIDSDFYFVWSKFMKDELVKYYPQIEENRIRITGTPQFECHFDTNFQSKETFFKNHNLDLNKKYICFSGDDVTTSPNDQFYLEDVAKAVKKLNEKGHNIGIIYRKCPVDFTGRHLKIYNENKDVIKLIDPIWKNLGSNWNHVMPFPEDLDLLANTVKYTDMVINVGSSMVFDYVAQNKPCAFLNYNTKKKVNNIWNIDKIYKYIHFKSMPNKKAVLWINSKNDLEEIILEGINNSFNLSTTKEWFNKIVAAPQDKSSERIWTEIDRILCT